MTEGQGKKKKKNKAGREKKKKKQRKKEQKCEGVGAKKGKKKKQEGNVPGFPQDGRAEPFGSVGRRRTQPVLLRRCPLLHPAELTL